MWCCRKEQRPTTPVGPPPVLVDQLVDRKVKVGDKARLTIKGKHTAFILASKKGLNFVKKGDVFKTAYSPLVVLHMQ